MQLGLAFGWTSLALWDVEFGGPTISLEQCAVCSMLRCTSDEKVVRYVVGGNVTDIEPDCES